MRRVVALSIFLVAVAASAGAQERTFDGHLDYARGTATHVNSWGAGAAFQLTWGGNSAPARLNTSVGGDYTKQENSGPSQTSAALDVTIQPGGQSAITPYAGGSVSENWSGGSAKQWSGAKVGLETLAGLQFKPSKNSNISWKAEERFGYVQGQEHTLTTRVGFLVSL